MVAGKLTKVRCLGWFIQIGQSSLAPGFLPKSDKRPLPLGFSPKLDKRPLPLGFSPESDKRPLPLGFPLNRTSVPCQWNFA
jgi:hypothetical protein